MSETSLDRDIGSKPVGAQHPAGANPRDGEAFEAMKAQIDLLTDIHANSQVDWGLVVRLAAQVLEKEGKDLAAGTWLTAALLETGGLAGLADGIHILRDLVLTYWDEMSPPAARLRGRRNQIQWLLDHLNERLQPQQARYAPLSADAHAAMLQAWETLDAAWQEHDDEAPAFYGLRSTLRALPVEAAPAAAGADAPAAAPPGPQGGTDRPAAATRGAAGTPVAQANAGAYAPPPVAASAASAIVPIAGADPEATAQASLHVLRPLIDWYLQTQPTLPLLFRLNRVCAWATLEQLPPSQGAQTLLMPPPLQIVASFQLIAQTGEPQAIVQFAESHLIAHRYWLDLNRASHAALTRLGAADAAATVAFETSRLIARLGGLQELRFSDGQAFADPETCAWLQGLAGTGAPATTEKDGDELATLASAAEADAVSGRLDDALDRLQAASRRAEGLRTRFRLRLTQCALLHRFDGRADIRPLLAPLIEELDAHRLPLWEPELARQTLALAAAVELRYGADDAGPSNPLLARLASVDPRAAWQLSQSTAAA